VTGGHERDHAYRLVQRNALRAWEQKLDFRSLVEADPEIDLDPAGVAEAFDLDDALRHVDILFERLSTLASETREPVHA
jgi:adenylosuccinate lyase